MDSIKCCSRIFFSFSSLKTADCHVFPLAKAVSRRMVDKPLICKNGKPMSFKSIQTAFVVFGK